MYVYVVCVYVHVCVCVLCDNTEVGFVGANVGSGVGLVGLCVGSGVEGFIVVGAYDGPYDGIFVGPI